MKAEFSTKGYTLIPTFVEEYKGYQIIKVVQYKHSWDNWEKKYFKKFRGQLQGTKNAYYTFCDSGADISKENTHYMTNRGDEEGCKICIDKLVDGTMYYFTNGEFHKEVTSYCAKKGWGFSKKDLLAMLKRHKSGTLRDKAIVEERLTDANFHSYCSLICDGDYNGYLELVRKEYANEFSFQVSIKDYDCILNNGEDLRGWIKESLEKMLMEKSRSLEVDNVSLIE